ncbi:MAG: DUF5996 family protein [Thermoleophilia bacterium]
MAQQTTWPALDSGACRDTLTTLHLCVQIVGKVQLALTPSMAGWEQAPLRLTPRGLTTQLLWTGDRSMTIQFDLTGHELRFDLSDGAQRALPLEPRPVAEFYAAVTATLADLGVEVTLEPTSVQMPEPLSCATDTIHASYDRACVASLLQVWTRVGAAFDQFRSGFRGKQTPVDLWWGTFDLSVVRYSGRPASPPFDRDAIERVAMDAEQSLVGFWPGDELSPEPAFFSYTYPKPAGIEAAVVMPEGALWSPDAGEFIVPYDVIRGADDPGRALLDFCESTYAAGARLAGWDRGLLERQPSVRRVA